MCKRPAARARAPEAPRLPLQAALRVTRLGLHQQMSCCTASSTAAAPPGQLGHAAPTAKIACPINQALLETRAAGRVSTTSHPRNLPLATWLQLRLPHAASQPAGWHGSGDMHCNGLGGCWKLLGNTKKSSHPPELTMLLERLLGRLPPISLQALQRLGSAGAGGRVGGDALLDQRQRSLQRGHVAGRKVVGAHGRKAAGARGRQAGRRLGAHGRQKVPSAILAAPAPNARGSAATLGILLDTRVAPSGGLQALPVDTKQCMQAGQPLAGRRPLMGAVVPPTARGRPSPYPSPLPLSIRWALEGGGTIPVLTAGSGWSAQSV